jgi:hypothetical protein
MPGRSGPPVPPRTQCPPRGTVCGAGRASTRLSHSAEDTVQGGATHVERVGRRGSSCRHRSGRWWALGHGLLLLQLPGLVFFLALFALLLCGQRLLAAVHRAGTLLPAVVHVLRLSAPQPIHPHRPCHERPRARVRAPPAAAAAAPGRTGTATAAAATTTTIVVKKTEHGTVHLYRLPYDVGRRRCALVPLPAGARVPQAARPDGVGTGVRQGERLCASVGRRGDGAPAHAC